MNHVTYDMPWIPLTKEIKVRSEAPTTADREEISHGITEGLSGPAMA